ncbi:MAG: hypothetical protein HZB51_06880 [Chloroflexi bacterium]|nr:hypothetical protein [Chloroflexota bacterium]
MMTSQTVAVKKTPKTNTATVIKTLVMAGSLAGTIGGWALLAAGQLQNSVSTMQQNPTITQPSTNPAVNNPTTNLRQVTVPNSQPRSMTRTRSSR